MYMLSGVDISHTPQFNTLETCFLNVNHPAFNPALFSCCEAALNCFSTQLI